MKKIKETKLPSVSVIIPCRNEEKFIGRCLNSIIRNYYPKDKIEILIIDGMSEDNTQEIIKRFTRKYKFVKLFHNKSRITPIALNMGIKNSRGDILIRVDAHSCCDKEYIIRCVEALEKYKVDSVGGVWKIFPRKNTLIGRSIALVLSNKFGVGNAHYKTGVKKIKEVDTVPYFCCRKEIFNRVGLFNEKLVRGQDLEWNLRLRRRGGIILLEPKIVNKYYVRSDFFEFIKHNFKNGVWTISPFKFSKRPVSFRHLVPLVFVSSLLLSGIFSIFLRPFMYLFLFILGLYVITNLIFSVSISIKERDWRYLFSLPLIFVSLHFFYGFGSLAGLFKLLFEK